MRARSRDAACCISAAASSARHVPAPAFMAGAPRMPITPALGIPWARVMARRRSGAEAPSASGRTRAYLPRSPETFPSREIMKKPSPLCLRFPAAIAAYHEVVELAPRERVKRQLPSAHAGAELKSKARRRATTRRVVRRRRGCASPCTCAGCVDAFDVRSIQGSSAWSSALKTRYGARPPEPRYPPASKTRAPGVPKPRGKRRPSAVLTAQLEKRTGRCCVARQIRRRDLPRACVV